MSNTLLEGKLFELFVKIKFLTSNVMRIKAKTHECMINIFKAMKVIYYPLICRYFKFGTNTINPKKVMNNLF